MRFPETAKSGTSLAFSLGLIASVIVVGWYYVILPYQRHPQRPTFTNDLKAAPVPTSPIAEIKVPVMPQPTYKAKPKPNDAKYLGKVNASIGLVFRADPSQSAKNVGGADYNTKVAVMRETPDREWVYVRNESTKEEGWVRIGNITKE
ncbi:SH3 domain-containing protein [Pseudanabaena sp. UWO310]|uniref:SH3 domain-containing protein n=1 Tax=Pseudanabaena sp. UWO310 TaxID=2480795 RepID=UPI001157A342|nr:SH3 domain-containing protein [Pseudanabaena sp. UWO310]TYQ30834.1 SH3 domain-containing protein [Pseudanabaena sp. UWO310]